MDVSKRERVFLGLMAAAVVVSAVVMAWPTGAPQSPEMTPQKLADSRKAAEAALQALERIQPTPIEIHAAKGAQEPWNKDPLAPKPPEADAPVERDKFAYTGFLKLGDRLLAVINGREYQVGEQLETGGFEVVSITAEAVELQGVVRKNRVRITYQDPSFFGTR